MYKQLILQEYCFIALDVFGKNKYSEERSRLKAWLSLLSADTVDDLARLVADYPWMGAICVDMSEYLHKPEEVLGMFSEALRILDNNTAQYMVDEMQKDIDEKNKTIAEQSNALAEKEQRPRGAEECHRGERQRPRGKGCRDFAAEGASRRKIDSAFARNDHGASLSTISVSVLAGVEQGMLQDYFTRKFAFTPVIMYNRESNKETIRFVVCINPDSHGLHIQEGE